MTEPRYWHTGPLPPKAVRRARFLGRVIAYGSLVVGGAVLVLIAVGLWVAAHSILGVK